MDDKPIGMINDLHTGLVRGMYGYLEDFKCDRCGKLASIVHSYKGLALCISCEEEAKMSRTRTRTELPAKHNESERKRGRSKTAMYREEGEGFVLVLDLLKETKKE